MKEKYYPTFEEIATSPEIQSHIFLGPHPSYTECLKNELIYGKTTKFGEGAYVLMLTFFNDINVGCHPFTLKEHHLGSYDESWKNVHKLFRLVTEEEKQAIFDMSSLEAMDKHPNIWKKSAFDVPVNSYDHQAFTVQFVHPLSRWDKPFAHYVYAGYGLGFDKNLEKKPDAFHKDSIPFQRWRIAGDDEYDASYEIAEVSHEISRLTNLVNKRKKRKLDDTTKLDKRILDLEAELAILHDYHGIYMFS